MVKKVPVSVAGVAGSRSGCFDLSFAKVNRGPRVRVVVWSEVRTLREDSMTHTDGLQVDLLPQWASRIQFKLESMFFKAQGSSITTPSRQNYFFLRQHHQFTGISSSIFFS